MERKYKSLILLVVALLLAAAPAHAQYEGDDVYDPFADYSEFEENSQEEADIHFFRNGRFFNVAFMFGWRQYTSDAAEVIDPSISPGIYLSYFFNLRFAVQFSYIFSQHRMSILPPGPQGQNFDPIKGNISSSSIGIDLKYYFNTQNVTRGLADLNPYIIGGFSQNFRTFIFENEIAVAKDDATGIDLGFGIEVPIADNHMYVGLQFMYRKVDFPTENQQFFDGNISPNPTGVFITGDEWNLFSILGINF